MVTIDTNPTDVYLSTDQTCRVVAIHPGNTPAISLQMTFNHAVLPSYQFQSGMLLHPGEVIGLTATYNADFQGLQPMVDPPGPVNPDSAVRVTFSAKSAKTGEMSTLTVDVIVSSSGDPG